jgi:hypothetical protein
MAAQNALSCEYMLVHFSFQVDITIISLSLTVEYMLLLLLFFFQIEFFVDRSPHRSAIHNTHSRRFQFNWRTFYGD